MNHKSSLITVFIILILSLSGCKIKNQDNNNTVLNQTSNEIESSKPIPDSTIHQAALNGNLPEVTKFLSEGISVNTLDQDGRSALMYSSFNGHVNVVKKLIESGAEINTCDNNGRTALMFASSGPFPSVVKLLLDNKADPDIPDKEDHFTALMYASFEGQSDVVKLLIAYKADPDLEDINGETAFSFALNNNHTEIASLLQSYAALINNTETVNQK